MIALFYVTMSVFILICVILILLILIQKGRGGGLASAFGGAGGQTAFGSKTGDVLTWATSVVFAVFVVFAVLLNLIGNHIDAKRNGSVAAAITANAPTAPVNPGPSVPPPAGETDVAHQPVQTPAQPTEAPGAPGIVPAPTSPTTMPAASENIQIPTTFPTTLP
jgi:preprotein translocase subunit SecG